MSKLKISELFYSIQGEGRYMGVPSVFLRTFGCNFTCDGFGMTKGGKSIERDIVARNISEYKQYRDLPLVSTGCDSYASWDPRFKDLSPLLTTESIVKSITEILPFKAWRDEHLVITGGEPLLGWQRSYPDLLSHELMRSLKELTFETNGTQHLTDDFASYLHREWHHDGTINIGKGRETITFSVSPKLSISGESWSDAIKPDVVAQLNEYGYTYLKFVVATKSDADEAAEAVNQYRKAGFDGPVYLMPLGGVENLYNMNAKTVAVEAMDRGWRYSDRLQVPLFKNEWGT